MKLVITRDNLAVAVGCNKKFPSRNHFIAIEQSKEIAYDDIYFFIDHFIIHLGTFPRSGPNYLTAPKTTFF